MASSSSNVENLSPEVLKMVSKELIKLTKEPLDGIKVFINEEDISDIQASIEGPGGTPYEKGNFKMKLVLGKDFPASPPQGFFLTKIFHPNVASNGAICVNTLKRDWKPDHGIRHILLTIKCLLIYPNPNSALNEEAGKLLQEEYDTYFERAKMITAIHAKSTQKQDEAMQAEMTAKRKCMDAESHIGKKKKDKKGLKRL